MKTVITFRVVGSVRQYGKQVANLGSILIPISAVVTRLLSVTAALRCRG